MSRAILCAEQALKATSVCSQSLAMLMFSLQKVLESHLCSPVLERSSTSSWKDWLTNDLLRSHLKDRIRTPLSPSTLRSHVLSAFQSNNWLIKI